MECGEICLFVLRCAGDGCNLAVDGGLSRLNECLVPDDQGGLGGVKGDPSCTHEGQIKHEIEDEDSMLIKSSEGDADTSDKTS